MVDVLSLAGVVTMSVSHPHSVGCYKVMASTVNLVKYCNCSDYDILTYVPVKYYIFHGSSIHLYVHTIIRSYNIPLQHKVVYSSILTL